MFSLTISLIAILLAAILLSVSLYYFNASTEHAEKDITAAALISQGEQILAAVDMRAMDNDHDMSHVDFLTDGKYLSSLPTPPAGTYEIGTEKPSPKDWRVLTAAQKPPIVLSDKLDLETCLLVNEKSGVAGIKSTADPKRRIQCFGTEAPFTMLLNPTAKQWPTCETSPLLPGCKPPITYCEANPFAKECVCKEYPSHPLCKKPDTCKEDPTLPGCPTFCEENPMHPDCIDICILIPDDPICNPDFCKLYPEHPFCKETPFCEMYPTHPLCVACPGGDCEPPTVCEVVETAPCDLTATGSCVEGAYKYTLLNGTIYRCDEKPSECKVTHKVIDYEPGYWLVTYSIDGGRCGAGQACTGGGSYVVKYYHLVSNFGRYVNIQYVPPSYTYELTNSCTGTCTLIPLELPTPPEQPPGICVGVEQCANLKAMWDAYYVEYAEYQAKVDEYNSNKSRYTVIGGKYYECGEVVDEEDHICEYSDVDHAQFEYYVSECMQKPVCWLHYAMVSEMLGRPDDFMTIPGVTEFFDKIGMAWDAGDEVWLIRGTMTYDYLHERNSSMPESKWTDATEDYIPLPTWRPTAYVSDLLHLHQVTIKTEGIPKICGY